MRRSVRPTERRLGRTAGRKTVRRETLRLKVITNVIRLFTTVMGSDASSEQETLFALKCTESCA